MPPGVNVVPGVDVAVCPLLSGSTVVTGPGPNVSKPDRLALSASTPPVTSVVPGYALPSGSFDAYSSAVEIVIRPGVLTLVVTPTTPFCATRPPRRFTLPREACTIPVFVSVPTGVRSTVVPFCVVTIWPLSSGNSSWGLFSGHCSAAAHTDTRGQHTWPSVAVMLPPFVTFGAATSTNPPSLTVPFVCVTIDAPCSIVMSPGA